MRCALRVSARVEEGQTRVVALRSAPSPSLLVPLHRPARLPHVPVGPGGVPKSDAMRRQATGCRARC